MDGNDDKRRSGDSRKRRASHGQRERGERGGQGRETSGRTRREPAGIERAQRRPDAPPRAMATQKGSGAPRPSAREPELSQDAPVDLAKGARRDVERATADKETAHRLLQHATAAFAALDEREGRVALPHLQYLKARLPRTGFIREALGVALYLTESYKDALSELQAFRRLTGSVDQNHLMADCIRAVGDGEHRIPGLIEEMENAEEAPADAARYEGRIVWASWLADTGDVGAGRAVLTDILEEAVADDDVDEHRLRLWYVAGDLAQRAEDYATARRWFGRITEVARGFFDTEERLEQVT